MISYFHPVVKIFKRYQQRFKYHGWSWGKVDQTQPHISIYSERRQKKLIALVGPDKLKDRVIFEAVDLSSPDRIRQQITLLDCLFNREMLIDRWEYAIYHCSTTSNAYSYINNGVSWSYINLDTADKTDSKAI